MRTITKLKGLLIGLFTATLAFACVALTPKTAPAPVSAETTVCVDKVTTIQDGVSGNRDLVTLVFDNPITDLTAQNRNASFTSSTTTETWVDYVKINGKTIRQSIAGYAWAHDNVYWCTNNEQIKMSFSSHDNSTVALKYDGTDTIEILAGFTGQNGAVTTEDVKFSNASGSWQRAYDEEDISGSIAWNDVTKTNEGFRYSFSTPLIWNWGGAVNDIKYMANNNRDWYNYITVNGKTMEEIASEVDDSEWTYTEFPSRNGGIYATPVWAMSMLKSDKNIFYLNIHQNYIDMLLETDGKIVIGVLANGINGLKDSTTKYVVKETVELDVLQQSASLTLNEGLQFNYKTKLPSLGFSVDAYKAEFTFMGETTEIGYSSEESGKKVYVFDGITPQYMNEDLTIKCVLTSGGRVFAWNTTTISVQEYCETLYATASDELKTLLVDVLNYGAAAQQYKGITENLVNANVDQQYATATAPTASDNVLAASQGDDVKFNAAVLTLEDKVTVTAKFTASNVDGLTATVQLGNNTAVAADIVALGNGVYGIVFADVAATQYDEAIVFTVSDTSGVVAKCRYSVNTYAQRTWDDATAGALAKALWAYGVSASAYAALV